MTTNVKLSQEEIFANLVLASQSSALRNTRSLRRHKEINQADDSTSAKIIPNSQVSNATESNSGAISSSTVRSEPRADTSNNFQIDAHPASDSEDEEVTEEDDLRIRKHRPRGSRYHRRYTRQTAAESRETTPSSLQRSKRDLNSDSIVLTEDEYNNQSDLTLTPTPASAAASTSRRNAPSSSPYNRGLRMVKNRPISRQILKSMVINKMLDESNQN
ncbi:unnamed protein product [[Candida] boidinii]|nr:unnamed protein product [[Candida] boidinii]